MTAPTGGVISTASDLGLYLRMMLNGRDDIIPAENKLLMMRPASDVSPHYGLGWSINPANGEVSHSGLVPGVETLAVLYPDQKKAVVVLINSNSGMGFGMNSNLLYGISAKALGHGFSRFNNSWGVKSLFLMFGLMPIIFIASILRLIVSRQGLISKSGLSGMLSLWVPLPIMIILAWVCIKLIPGLFGVSVNTLSHYQPDFVILLCVTAISGVVWALSRLGFFYRHRR